VIGTVVEDSRVRRSGGRESTPRSTGSHRGDNSAGPAPQQREPDYSPGTAVARGTRERPHGAPTPPATGNTSTTATSPDWSRFSGGDEMQQQQPADTSDSTETAVHKAIEA
jgi:hypothetical protein